MKRNIEARTRAASFSLGRSHLLALALASAGCQVNILPFESRACDAVHPCLDGWTCVRQTCALPFDGGLAREWPTAATTGVVAGSTLTPSGALRITQAGRVVENLDIRGCVDVAADNVVLRNLRIRGDGQCTRSALIDANTARGTVVEDVELDGTGQDDVYAIRAAEAVFRRIHIHHASSGIRGLGSHLTLEDSLMDDLASPTGAQAFVSAGGTGIVARHNVLEVSGGGQVIGLVTQDGPLSDVLIEANLINGGGWSVSGGRGGGNASNGIRFVRNRFGRKFYDKCGVWGPVESFDPSGPGNVWLDNVWDDTSAPVQP